MKECYICKTLKPKTEFYRKSSKKDGVGSYCKQCEKEYRKKWSKTERGKLLNKKLAFNYQKKLRGRVMAFLGSVCSCGYSDERALHIDHINGDGGKERKSGKYAWSSFYSKILAGEYIGKIQLLCANCNMIKKNTNKEYKNDYIQDKKTTSTGRTSE